MNYIKCPDLHIKINVFNPISIEVWWGDIPKIFLLGITENVQIWTQKSCMEPIPPWRTAGQEANLKKDIFAGNYIIYLHRKIIYGTSNLLRLGDFG